MFTQTSRKLILVAAAFAIAFAAADASAKPVVIPKGPVKIAPKGPIIVKPIGPKVFPKKPPIIIVKKPHWHPHFVPPVYVVGQPIVLLVAVVERPVAWPSSCLTKDYTPQGHVVYKDLCTKEVAMAPVEGVEPQKSSEAAPQPNNFAGKTYQDYLAANGTQQN